MPAGASRNASMLKGSELADRISYVIGPQGKVLYVYSSPNPDEHVKRTLAAVEKWKAAKAP